MSKLDQKPKTTVASIRSRKNKEPIICLTAYTTPMTVLLDPHVDLLLVGDSVGMVMHGHNSTVPVTVDEMILHANAVMRANPNCVVVVDMPFGSYEASPQQAHETAVQILKTTGADAVKIEGGVLQAPTIEFLTQRGIAVMGHIGLRPQAVMSTGGYRVVGKTKAEIEELEQDAKAVTKAGAFSIVLEGVIEPVARDLTKSIPIPTIGIGASPACDGQILVTEDMLGLFEHTPKFVKKFATLNTIISKAVADYAAEVKDKTFPSEQEVYHPPKSKT